MEENEKMPEDMNQDTKDDMHMGTEMKEGSAGPVIGIIIILAIIILGGLYFWGQKSTDELAPVEERVEEINTQSESDDLSDIEADLEATDIENLDAELNAS